MTEFGHELPKDPAFNDSQGPYDPGIIESVAITSDLQPPEIEDTPPTYMPEYMAAATTAEIDPHTASQLALSALAHAAFLAEKPPEVMGGLTRAVRASAAYSGNQEGQYEGDIAAAIQRVVAAGGNKGVVTGSLDAYTVGVGAGIDPGHSAQAIEAYLSSCSPGQATRIHTLRDALGTMQGLAIEGSGIKSEVGSRLAATSPFIRPIALRSFTRALAYGTARLGVSGEGVLLAADDALRTGEDLTEVFSAMFGSELTHPYYRPGNDSRGYWVNPDSRFVHEHKGALLPLAVSYRASRSLEEGLGDLAAYMDEGPITPAEGAWVFDPQSQTWYSLGGQPNLMRNGHGLQHGHQAVPTDISRLSSTPVSVHMHPDRLEANDGHLSVLLPHPDDFIRAAEQLEHAQETVSLSNFVVTPRGVVELVHDNKPHNLRRAGKALATTTSILRQTTPADQYKILERELGAEGAYRLLLNSAQHELPGGYRFVYHPAPSHTQ